MNFRNQLILFLFLPNKLSGLGKFQNNIFECFRNININSVSQKFCSIISFKNLCKIQPPTFKFNNLFLRTHSIINEYLIAN